MSRVARLTCHAGHGANHVEHGTHMESLYDLRCSTICSAMQLCAPYSFSNDKIGPLSRFTIEEYTRGNYHCIDTVQHEVCLEQDSYLVVRFSVTGNNIVYAILPLTIEEPTRGRVGTEIVYYSNKQLWRSCGPECASANIDFPPPSKWCAVATSSSTEHTQYLQEVYYADAESTLTATSQFWCLRSGVRLDLAKGAIWPY